MPKMFQVKLTVILIRYLVHNMERVIVRWLHYII